MLYPFQILLDFIFPPTNHELVLRTVSPQRFLLFYDLKQKDSIEFLTSYHIPSVQAAIAACKFEHSYHAAQLLGTLIETHLKTLPSKKTLIIPIPLSTTRERERGFNQVARALCYVGELPYPFFVATNILSRTHNTVAQTSLSRTARLKNMHRAFICKPQHREALNEYERIILCDDVYTTGSTLTAAKAALTPYLSTSTELCVLAWAH